MTQEEQTRPKFLTCACCGERARGRQWHDRDTGYGVCSRCFRASFLRDGRDEAERLYGRAGEHHSLDWESERDLSRTAAALAAFDEFDSKFHERVLATRSHAELSKLDAENERLAREVGVAFGLDTDRAIGGPNDPQVCADLIRPGPAKPPPGCELSFVRRMVRLWRDRNRVDTESLRKSENSGSSLGPGEPKRPAPGRGAPETKEI